MTTRPVILVAEDELSGAVLKRLIIFSNCNLAVRQFLNTHGNSKLQAGLAKFKGASRAVAHIVLTDLDRRECPLRLINDWKVMPLPTEMLFRIAIRQTEAWLLADRQGIAAFLHVAVNKVPTYPEAEFDSKQSLFHLARSSRNRRLAEEILPAHGSSAPIGPLYNQRLSEFVERSWDISAALKNAPSLERAIRRLREF